MEMVVGVKTIEATFATVGVELPPHPLNVNASENRTGMKANVIADRRM